MTSAQDPNHIVIPSKPLKPQVDSNDVIAELLATRYGLTATEITSLNGYDDLNFRVKVAPSHTNPNLGQVSPEGYFLKVINLNDSGNPEYLNAQLSVMEHIWKKGIKCQSVIRGTKGEQFTECVAATKKGEVLTYLVSLRTFLPGDVLARKALSNDLLYTLGQYVAEVTCALEDFSNPFYDSFDCVWSMNSVPKLADVTFAVKDESLRKICEDVIEKFQNEVLPLKSGFRIGQIHGDLNEQNILVLEAADGSVAVSGLVDYQDTARSHPLYDLAILVCYMMMVSSELPVEDIPGHVLAGYTSKLDLTPSEKLAFRTCVAARMVQSLVMGAYTHQMDPSNEYVLVTGKYGWRALERFWTTDKEALQTRWDQIMGTYKKKS
ncbi:unnamed protein product [Lymnaea stagnalis]|uniref:Hydroxylysine kinase n=1 Tax=Lymnaea stagnalis TaxID=6523 RepID=A0AAV2IH22_LYMST